MKGWMLGILLLCFSTGVCAVTFSSDIEAVSPLMVPIEAVAPVAMVEGQGLQQYPFAEHRPAEQHYRACELYLLSRRKGLVSAGAATGSFGSTSAYICSGMVAAAAVPVTTTDIMSASASQRRKAPTGGGSSTGEWINPIGDAWWFLVLLAAGYAVVRGKQRRRKEV